MIAINKKDLPGIEKSFMVRQVDYRWNQVYPSLMLMYEKLERFGLIRIHDKVLYPSKEVAMND